MRLATFTRAGRTRIGVVRGEAMVDLAAHAPTLPQTMRELLEAGPEALDLARQAAAEAKTEIPLSQLRLEAPVPNPRKFLGIGGNTRGLGTGASDEAATAG